MKDTGSNLSADLWPHVQGHPVLASLWMALEQIREKNVDAWNRLEEAYGEAYAADQAAATLRGMPDQKAPASTVQGRDRVIQEMLQIVGKAPSNPKNNSGHSSDDQDVLVWLNNMVSAGHTVKTVGGTYLL